MRIISGKYKGRPIKMPKRMRPTQNKVRKALFDILGDIEDLSFLELFAGSGAVGLEALSQGAGQVVFVESDPACLKALRDNFTYLMPDTYRLLLLDALAAIRRLSKDKKQFDIVFLDPPYYKGKVPRSRINIARCSGLMGDNEKEPLTKKTLQTLSAYDILAPNGFIIVQHFKRDILPDSIGNLTIFRQARYGDTFLSFYKKMS